MRKLPKQTAQENCRYEATYNAALSPHPSLSEDLRAACCGTDLVDYYVATNLAASAPACARSASLGVKAVPRASRRLLLLHVVLEHGHEKAWLPPDPTGMFTSPGSPPKS
jgi:hypothetical protein